MSECDDRCKPRMCGQRNYHGCDSHKEKKSPKCFSDKIYNKIDRSREFDEWAKSRDLVTGSDLKGKLEASGGRDGMMGHRGPPGVRGSPGIVETNNKIRNTPSKITENGQNVVFDEAESTTLDLGPSGIYIININVIWSLKFKNEPNISNRNYRVDFELYEIAENQKSDNKIAENNKSDNKILDDKNSKNSKDAVAPTLAKMTYSDNITLPGGFIERSQSCASRIRIENKDSKLSLRVRGVDFNLLENGSVVIEEMTINSLFLLS